MKTRAGVYFVEVDGEAVVLDLHTNRYFGLSAASAAIWRSLEREDAPREIADTLEQLGVPSAHVETVVHRQQTIWAEAGLLAPASGSPPTTLPQSRAAAGAPRADLDASRLAATPIRSRDLWTAAVEAARVRWSLRVSGTPRTIRKTQRIGADAADDHGSIYAAAKACQVLRRPFRQGLPDCVYRSLVLARLLRRRRVDATICIGVRKLPFVAHAWVEVGGVVVNESLGVAQSFTRLVEF